MQKNKKQKKNSKVPTHKAVPATPLTKQERKAIEARMAKLKSSKKSSTQKTIPYLEMFQDGTCQITNSTYSKTIQFFDINYRLATFDEKNFIFSKYCDLLNYFDNTVKFQLTFENQNTDVDELLKMLEIPEQTDDFNDIRQEYSAMLKSQLIFGSNGRVLRKFLTFTVEASSLHNARLKLDSIAAEVQNILRSMGVASTILDGKERLEVLYRSLNPFSDDPFLFDWKYRIKSGASTKDFIAPTSLRFVKSNFEIGENGFGSVYSINLLAGELSDEVLYDYLSNDDLICVNLHVEPYDQIAALKFIKGKLSDVEKMKIDEQKKATQSGYDPNILPPSVKLYIDQLEKMLDDLNSKNERLFHITLTIRAYAESKKKMKLQQDLLKRITQKNSCKLFSLDYEQEQGLCSSLPLGYNNVKVNRVLTTSAIAVFVPFTTQELFQGTDASYYGLNSLSQNMIMGNRKLLKNPNGLILGTPGSGKSFSVKREILDTFLKTTDDIIICDPEAEYYPLVQALDGQLIKISTSSQQHINPMDIVWDNEEDDENPIAVKSDFLISLMELIVGGKYGLTAEERSIVDQCVRNIYNHFLSHNPSKETMPILEDLLKELRENGGDIAKRVANSLEMYVTGSQNVFNHRTTVDLNNRIICFDIKQLGNQLRKVGMLIVQDQVWNRVSLNRGNKSTRYYIDEFHLLLKEEQTAKYSVEMWKRFRKWGGIPTGITQNIKDLLQSQEIENIFDNSDFIYMLNQAAGDRDILAEKLHISDQQLKYVTNAGRGQGLIFFGDTILPFVDRFPRDTKMYQLMTTDPADLANKVS